MTGVVPVVAAVAALLASAIGISWFIVEYRAIDRMIRDDLARLRAQEVADD